MDIQRYDPYIQPGYGGETFPGMEEDETGAYVRFSDHLSALSKSQKHMEALEDVLQELLSALGEKERYVPESQRGQDATQRWLKAWSSARSILGAKEGGNGP